MTNEELKKANELKNKIDKTNKFIDSTIEHMGLMKLQSIKMKKRVSIFAETGHPPYSYRDYEVPEEVSSAILEVLCKQVKEWEKELADM